MKPSRGKRAQNRKRAAEMARRDRWSAKCLSRVTHPVYGSVVVPHCSNLAARMNAAEVWGCDWTELSDATVYAAEPGAVAAQMPTPKRSRPRRKEATVYFLERREPVFMPNIPGSPAQPVPAYRWKAVYTCTEWEPLEALMAQMDKTMYRITSNRPQPQKTTERRI